jgi:hypothetical protein
VPFLADTNILLRLAKPSDPDYTEYDLPKGKPGTGLKCLYPGGRLRVRATPSPSQRAALALHRSGTPGAGDEEILPC